MFSETGSPIVLFLGYSESKRAGDLPTSERVGKIMNTVFYAMIYIVAAVLLVTGVFLGIPALML